MFYYTIAAHAAVALVLAVLVAASAPSLSRGSRWASLVVSILISTACAAAMIAGLTPLESLYRGNRFVIMQILEAAVYYAAVVVVLRLVLAGTVIRIGAAIWRAAHKFPRRFGPTLCRWCAFDQAGLPPHEVCPECGHPWRVSRYSARSNIDRPLRGLCRVIVACAGLVIFCGQIPKFVVDWHYRTIELPSASGFAWGSAEPTAGHNLLQIQSTSGKLFWLSIITRVDPESMHLNPRGGYVRTRFYDTEPFSGPGVKPLLERDGFISGAEIKAIMDAPQSPLP